MNRKLAWYASLFALATILNAAWFFGYALPRNPPPRPPAPRRAQATAGERDRYLEALDRAQFLRFERARAIGTAVGIEILIAAGIAIVALFHHGARKSVR